MVIFSLLLRPWFALNIIFELWVNMMRVAGNFATSWHMLVERNDFSKGVLHLHFPVEGPSHKPILAEVALGSREFGGWRLQINLTIIQRILFPLLRDVRSIENAIRKCVVFGISGTVLSRVSFTPSRKDLFLAMVSKNAIRSLFLDVLDNLFIFFSFLPLFFKRHSCSMNAFTHRLFIFCKDGTIGVLHIFILIYFIQNKQINLM